MSDGKSDLKSTTRRGILSAVSWAALAGIAGCAGSPSGGQPTSSATPSPPTTSPCFEGNEKIPPCPTKPNSLTNETTLEFATQLEQAYQTRKVFRKHDCVRDFLHVDVTDENDGMTASETEDGWVARFTVSGPSYRYGGGSGSGTVVVVDGGFVEVSYLITDQSVWRAAGSESGDLREAGEVVTCPPE